MKFLPSIVLSLGINLASAYEPRGTYIFQTDQAENARLNEDELVLEDAILNIGWEDGLKVYEQGGNAFAYAVLNLNSPVPESIEAGTVFSGLSLVGDVVVAEALEDIESGATMIKLRYQNAGECEVGGMPLTRHVYDGCFMFFGEVSSGVTKYSYTYSLQDGNKNSKTIQSLVSIKDPEEEHAKYQIDWWGNEDYANNIVMSAFAGVSTNMAEGRNIDFSLYGQDGRIEGAKKGAVYVGVFMHIVQMFDDAISKCKEGESYMNDDAMRSWEEAVAVYMGDEVMPDGSGKGKFFWGLAQKRCPNFFTCSESGIAENNLEQLQNFKIGQDQLNKGKCAAAMWTKKKIVNLMYIPVIQGVLRYAYKVGFYAGGERADVPEKLEAEGLAFMAGVIGRVNAKSPEAAQIIWDNMKLGATSTSYVAVKEAFESVYTNMGIKCWQVGEYYYGFEEGNDDAVKACTQKCFAKPNKKFEVPGTGAKFTCGQLAQMDSELQKNMCNKQGAKSKCKGVCSGDCKCNDKKYGRFNDGETEYTRTACLDLSQKADYKKICNELPDAKLRCPDTCAGWCKPNTFD